MTVSPGEVTLLLEQVRRGNKQAEAELAPLIYQELRRIAGYYMRNERPGHTLQPTAVVNEIYLRLVDQSRVDWKNRAHFFGVAAQLMRRFLLDYARERTAAKRGGHRVPMEIENFEMASVARVRRKFWRLTRRSRGSNASTGSRGVSLRCAVSADLRSRKPRTHWASLREL